MVFRAGWKFVHALETATIRELAPVGNGKNAARRREGPDRGLGKRPRLRGRPPAWVRRRSSVRPGSSGQPVREAVAARRAACDGRSSRAETPACGPWWTARTFSEAYDVARVRKAAVSGEEGPLDVADPARRYLFLLWVGVRRSPLDWKRVEQSWGVQEAATWIYAEAESLTRKGVGPRARARAALRLRKRGVPLASDLAVSVPGPEAAAAVRAGAHAALKKVAQQSEEVAAHMARYTAVRVAAGPQLRDRVRAVQVCRAASLKEIGALPLETVRSLGRGEDIRKVDGSLRVRIRQSPKEAQEAAEAGFKAWSSAARLAWRAREAGGQVVAQAIRRKPPMPERPEVVEHKKLFDVQRGEVLVLDDKDKARVWKRSDAGAQLDLFRYVIADPKWSVCAFGQDVAESLVRAVCSELLPEEVWRGGRASPGKEDKSIMPYMYNFLKAKCYQGGGPDEALWSCQKAGHSCARKVTSFWRIPGRKRWKLIGRGLLEIKSADGGSWEVFSMNDVPEVLRRRVRGLRRPANPHVCAR